MPLAQQIAARGVEIYVWDFSVNDNNDTLFETLTSRKSGHIFKGLNRTYDEIYNFASQKMLPEFRSFACGVPDATTTPHPSSPSQNNPPTSCCSCCSCCSCQNNNPPAPTTTTTTTPKPTTATGQSVG